MVGDSGECSSRSPSVGAPNLVASADRFGVDSSQAQAELALVAATSDVLDSDALDPHRRLAVADENQRCADRRQRTEERAVDHHAATPAVVRAHDNHLNYAAAADASPGVVSQLQPCNSQFLQNR